MKSERHLERLESLISFSVIFIHKLKKGRVPCFTHCFRKGGPAGAMLWIIPTHIGVETDLG